jgi:hypothetical protein
VSVRHYIIQGSNLGLSTPGIESCQRGFGVCQILYNKPRNLGRSTPGIEGCQGGLGVCQSLYNSR